MAFTAQIFWKDAGDGDGDRTTGVQVGAGVILIQATRRRAIAEEALHGRRTIACGGTFIGIRHSNAQTSVKQQRADLLVGLHLLRARGNQRHGVPVVGAARAVAAAEVHRAGKFRLVVRCNGIATSLDADGLLGPLEITQDLGRSRGDTAGRRIFLVTGFVKRIRLVIDGRRIVVIDTAGLGPT